MSGILAWITSLAMMWGLAAAPAAAASPSPALTPATVLRFRVIANSDDPVDQAIKLDVRDAVLRQLEPQLIGVKSRSKAIAVVGGDLAALSQTANRVLAAHPQAGYRARVELTTTAFPAKAYGSTVLPAGRYRALLVVLGRGAGHNWWCVLYPSLCFIDMAHGVAVPYPNPDSSSPPPPPQDPRRSGKIKVHWPHIPWKSLIHWF